MNLDGLEFVVRQRNEALAELAGGRGVRSRDRAAPRALTKIAKDLAQLAQALDNGR